MAEEVKGHLPYEKTHRLKSLLLVVTVVGRGQGDAIVSLANKYECNFSFISHGRGTAPNNFYAILGSGSLKKDVVFSIMKEINYQGFEKELKARFAVSAMAKGISYCIRMDSVAGVSVYKMLSNTRYFEKASKHMKK